MLLTLCNIVYASQVMAPNCPKCGAQMHQVFGVSGSGSGMSWNCPNRNHFSGGRPLDLGRSERGFRRTQRKHRKAEMRQKMKQHPLRFFVVEPLKATGRVAAEGLVAVGSVLFVFFFWVVAVALGFGLVFLLYLIVTANIIVSLVVVGIVVAVLAILALLYW